MHSWTVACYHRYLLEHVLPDALRLATDIPRIQIDLKIPHTTQRYHPLSSEPHHTAPTLPYHIPTTPPPAHMTPYPLDRPTS